MNRLACFALIACLVGIATATTDDILICDFEAKDYGQWEVTGKAFGPGPARGTLAGQMKVTGFKGKALVNSFFEGDDTTGTLTSPAFEIQRAYINFLIGGGMHPGKACINLLVDGKTVRTATGPNDRPGGSEQLDWSGWDVKNLIGKSARIQIVDKQTGGWGHINIDHIIQSNTGIEPAEKSRDLTFDKRYLNLPVKNGAPKRRMKLITDGKTVREFEIEIADEEPDFWVFLDVSGFRDKKGTIQVDRLGADSKALEQVHLADTIKGTENLYREKLRPQLHFTSRRGWNNDSNGLVFYKGEYHLYYQHNPYGFSWGNMHWGHAVSHDLVHWKELPIAIYPYQFGDWVFSGSAVVDKDNTAGFKTGDEDVIVAAFTSTGRGEAIAYSNDRGRTFTDYEGNPVVKHRGRDPKVIWYAPGRHWVMALYSDIEKKRTIAFYTSKDLKDWTYQSHVDGFFECPEIFELEVDGDSSNRRWIIYAADGDYMIGDFDGKTFTKESGKHKFSYGNCFYASQTYNNIPAEDGRRIQIAWGRITTPGMPFNQMMLFPVELALRTTDEGPRMFAVPIKEIEKLRLGRRVWNNLELEPDRNPLEGIEGELFDIEAEFEIGDAKQVGFAIRGTDVTYDAQKKQLSCRDKTAPLKPIDGRVQLRLLVDRTSIEIFANNGRIYMPMGIIHADDNRSLGLLTKGGTTTVRSLTLTELRSAWR